MKGFTMNSVLNAFNTRFADINNVQHRAQPATRIFDIVHHADVSALKRDQVLAGNSLERYPFLAINTLDGAFVMYNNANGEIVYFCPPSFANLATVKQAGFRTFGTIDTLDMFNHIFAIPDSYL
jgi:hypothetical protein